MTSSAQTNADFDAAYLSTWTEPDASKRLALIEQVWAPQGSLHVSSPGLSLTGTTDIAAHIEHVHNDLIANKGLTFAYDQRAESGDALLLRWSMTAPSGDVVGRGVDTVFRDTNGRVVSAYMFMGVN